MPVVVSDTSPIRALEFVACLDVLPVLFDHVLVPPAVVTELARPGLRYRRIDISRYSFLEVLAPTDQVQVNSLLQQLDLGEAEAIVLARECAAEAILIDEADGRAVAQQLGLVVVGTLGILLAAKQRGFVKTVVPLIDRLRDELGFFVSNTLRDEIVRRAGEAS